MPQQLVGQEVGGAGQFARAIFACNGDVAEAYNQTGYNASLPRETWEMISDMIVTETQKWLVAVNDLRSRPALLETVPIYTLVHTTAIESDMAPARQSMNPMVTPILVEQQYNNIGVPLPMVFEDTQLDMRTAAMPMPGGTTVRAQRIAIMTQKISEAHESNLFNGNPNIGAQDEQGNLRTIQGYTTHPNIVPVTPAGSFNDYANVKASIVAMKKALRDNYFRPPYMVYVGGDVWTYLENQNTAASERTWRLLLLDDPEIEDIKFTFDLAADEMLMVKLSPEVISWVQSADIQASDWDAMGIFGTNIREWSIAAPHVKATYAGRSGIALMTGIVNV